MLRDRIFTAGAPQPEPAREAGRRPARAHSPPPGAVRPAAADGEAAATVGAGPAGQALTEPAPDTGEAAAARPPARTRRAVRRQDRRENR